MSTKDSNVRWPYTISNEDLYSMTPTRPITDKIRRRRSWWIGHALCLPLTATARAALRWTPDGRRGKGRPRETWWGFLERAAQDMNKWKDLVEALCDNDINDKHNNNWDHRITSPDYNYIIPTIFYCHFYKFSKYIKYNEITKIFCTKCAWKFTGIKKHCHSISYININSFTVSKVLIILPSKRDMKICYIK